MTLQSHGAGLGEDELAQEIRSLAPWFHNLHLPGGRQTAPDHPLGDFPAFKWEQLAPHLPEDMSGLSVLDIGCNAGFYALRLAGRGARVLGVDVDEHYLRQARWARDRFGFGEDQIALRQMQVYELAQLEETFDVVLFMGVLYHLRYPLLALDIVASRVRDQLILQTLTMPGDDVLEAPEDLSLHARGAMQEPGWPVMAFIEHALAGDSTNWWAPNQACVEAMLRSTGLEPRERPGHEIIVARRTGPARMPDELRAILRASR
jgi:tRNA (mo5U34)-methyltransferase